MVERIYQGAADPEAWPSILREVVSFVGGSKGVLVTHFAAPQDGGFAFLHAIPESFLQQWADHYRNHDIWTQATAAKGLYQEGSVVLDTDLVKEDELLRSVFYREFLKPQGIARLCAGVVFGQETFGAMATACSVYRDLREAQFSESDRKRMQILLPHLSRALGVMYRLRDAELKSAATLAALDRLASGVLLLDAMCTIVHINAAARRMLDECDGLASRTDRPEVRERLEAADGNAQLAIEHAFATALEGDPIQASHFSESVSIPRLSEKPPYVLQCAPLAARNPFSSESSGVRAIVFITDPGRRPAPAAALLRKIYGISPAEARLATALCGGETLQEASRRALISEATARTQLRSLFDKTATHRQADLVRLLLSLASDQ